MTNPLKLTQRSTRLDRPQPRKLRALSAGEGAARAKWRRLFGPRPARADDPAGRGQIRHAAKRAHRSIRGSA